MDTDRVAQSAVSWILDGNLSVCGKSEFPQGFQKYSQRRDIRTCENVMPPALAIAGGRKRAGPAAATANYRSFLLMLLTHCVIIALTIKPLW